MAGPVSPLVLERYELKYTIPYSLVDPISQYVSAFCELDYYSEISPNGFYVINSLYFDTPGFLFYRKKENDAPDRFSLRIRSYGGSPKPPFYFETKEKMREFSRKRRGKVPIDNWQDIFLDPSAITGFDPMEDSHIRHFLNLTNTYNASPVLLTQYSRRAFLSTIDDYARVTFDAKFRFQRETNYNVIPDEQKMVNYDHPEYFKDPGTNVVLELKCERKVPAWIVDLIQYFQLTRGSFSKFESAMIESYGREMEPIAYDRIVAY